MSEENYSMSSSELASNKRKRSESPDGSKDEKRRKLEPSKVLFLRQLPLTCFEQDIAQLISEEFGHPNIVIVRSNHTGFIEFESIELATRFLNSLPDGELTIRDRKAYVTWSERKELDRKALEAETPSRVLLINVLNARHPLFVSNMEKLFSNYKIEKITCFTSRQGAQQALVQFATIQDATQAKANVEGVEIFNNCRIQIRFSKIGEITVKFNNDKSKDYTRPDHPLQQPPMQSYPPRPDSSYYYGQPHPHAPPPPHAFEGGAYGDYDAQYGGYGMHPPQYPPYMYNAPHPPMPQGRKVILVSNLSPKTTCDELFILFGVWGDVEAVKILSKKPDAAFVEFTTTQGAENALLYTKNIPLPLHGMDLVVQRSKHPFIKPPKMNQEDQLFKTYKGHPHHRFKSKRGGKVLTQPSTFLHFANLHGDLTEDGLMEYVSSFGTVKSLQLFGKKDCLTKDGQQITKQMAVVEFESLPDAVRVLVNRHVGDELLGLKPSVSFSLKRDAKA